MKFLIDVIIKELEGWTNDLGIPCIIFIYFKSWRRVKETQSLKNNNRLVGYSLAMR